jgi:hypothetical protein
LVSQELFGIAITLNKPKYVSDGGDQVSTA